jgi:UDP-N-acetylglucosamine--N-acetylmuramyl-(pentapeptide) pyrophosphoryl-undecaprenol N-acetylglucosamine transferase
VSAKRKRILIAGGGTGGHVFPALAIRQAIAELDSAAEVLFVGTKHGLEAKIIPHHGERLRTLWISGFSRQHMLRNLILPVKLLVSTVQSLWLLLSWRPAVVVGTGGYVMGPVLWLAQRLRIPTVLQEQNSRPGWTTRKLAQRASCVCLGFEDARHSLKSPHIEITGNPLRTTFILVDRAKANTAWNLDAARPTLLVFGGSTGARSINEAIASVLPSLLDQCNILWQTGKLGTPSITDKERMASAIAEKKLCVREFIDDMPSAYAAANLAVCRAGAITLGELAASALPAVLIPYPFATDDHQTANAKSVVTAGAARMISDASLTPEKLTDIVLQLLASPEELAAMSRNMQSLAKPDAARRIAEIVLSQAKIS